jgi:hypothetical protein
MKVIRKIQSSVESGVSIQAYKPQVCRDGLSRFQATPGSKPVPPNRVVLRVRSRSPGGPETEQNLRARCEEMFCDSSNDPLHSPELLIGCTRGGDHHQAVFN